MIALLVLLAAVAVAALCTQAVRRRRAERRKPPELRGDWWSEFERQFRAYARTVPRRAPERDSGASRRRSLG